MPASAVRDIRTAAFAPSTKSADALRAYTDGLQLERQGNHLEAQKRFEDSTEQDPELRWPIRNSDRPMLNSDTPTRRHRIRKAVIQLRTSRA